MTAQNPLVDEPQVNVNSELLTNPWPVQGRPHMVTASHELSPGWGSRKIQIYGSYANSGGVKCRQPLHWESTHATQVVAPPYKHHGAGGQDGDGEGASAPPSAALHQLQTLVCSKLCLDPRLCRPRVLSDLGSRLGCRRWRCFCEGLRDDRSPLGVMACARDQGHGS